MHRSVLKKRMGDRKKHREAQAMLAKESDSALLLG